MTKDTDTDESAVLEIVTISEDLQSEFITLPAYVARWSALYASATGALRRAEHAVDVAEAHAVLDVRDSGVKATVHEVRSVATVDPKVQAARAVAIDAEEYRVYVGGVLEALKTKRDMLMQLGPRDRMELERDPVTRKRSEWKAGKS